MQRLLRLLRVGLIMLIGASILVGARVSVVIADTPPVGATALFPSPNERFGFGVLYGIDSYDVVPLNAGWYQDWGYAASASHPGSILAAHVVRVSPDGLHLNLAAIQRLADEDPGALWLIGNEPDMFRQDNVTPIQYVTQYRQAYFAIKGYDPTAQVAAGGIVQPTPLRLGWLSVAWDTYQQLYGSPMPVDVWNIHNYILQETPGEWGCGIPPGYYGERPQTYPASSHDDLTIFQDHVRAMRQWMADHGQRDKPLIISEYGILFPGSSGYDLTRVSNFFVNTTNWMLTASDPALGYPADDNHLVQRWMWYSLDDTNFNDSGDTIAALMDPPTHQVRAMGQVFANQTTPLRRPYVNLVVARVQVQATDAGAASVGAAQPVTVQAVIQNRGNTAVTQAFRVLILDQNKQVIHAETINGMPARYGGNVVVQTTWQKPAGTDWQLTVLVDTENTVSESNENDNSSTVSPTADLHLASLAVLSPSGQDVAAQAVVSDLDLVASVQNLRGVTVSAATVRFWDGTQLLHEEALPDLASGAQVTVTFTWDAPQVGLHQPAVDLVMPPGISDPVEEDNYLGREVLIANSRAYLPAITGLDYQSGQTAGIECYNTLQNAGFEGGTLAGWNASPYVSLMDTSCFDGNYCAWMGRGLNIEDDIYQTVSIKPWASLQLDFAYAVVTAESASEQRDTLNVEVRSATGQLLRTVQTFDNRDARQVWYTSSLNLDEFAGQTIQLHFRAHNDGANLTTFFLDAVNLEACEKR